MALRARTVAFSVIEVVLGLFIISTIVAISVANYSTQAEKIRQDTASSQLQTYGNAIARWQMENNRTTYPFNDLEPLRGKYLDNIGTDPWGSALKVSPGNIYSLGPNGRDEGGTGDDMRFQYGVVLQSPPQAPSRLTCRLQGTSVKLSWSPPLRNVDGTELTTKVGTWSTEVFRSLTDGNYTTKPLKTVAFPERSLDDSGLTPQTSYYYTTRVKRSATGRADLFSAYSNQCGAFVVGSSQPEIRRFSASSYRLPINTPFSVDVDVVDPSASLTKVELSFDGKTYPLLAGGSNTFHFLRTFSPPDVPAAPRIVPPAQLSISGGIPPTSVTRALPQPVEFVNTAPVVTSLRPGLINLVVSPGTTRTVDFSVEARDNDRNLTKITIKDPTRAEDFAEPKVQFAIERVSWVYDLSTTRTVFVTAFATDELGSKSVEANAQVAIAADITPPETPVVDMNRSNTCLSKDRDVYSWSVRESRRVTIHAESFDSETPPVSFRIGISTRPPSNDPTALTSFVANAITQHRTSKVRGFTMPLTTNVMVLEYKDSADGDLAEPLKEGKFYYLGVQAVNKSGRRNESVVAPKNPETGYPQNPFLLDFTPPRIVSVGIGNPGRGFVCGGTVVGRWRAEDLIADKTKDGSGAYLFRYQFFERLRTEITTTNPDAIGRLIFSQENQATEVRFPLPVDPSTALSRYHQARYTLGVKVRDNACNWSTTTSMAFVIEDTTPPLSTTTSPRIIAPAGTLNDPNTLEGVWNGVFFDPEEVAVGVKSYEWGVTKKCCEPNLPFPEVFPGDGTWRFAGTSTGDRAIRQNMLLNGDTVFLAVRAYNWAGCGSSIVTYSAPVLVDTSLQLNVFPFPTLAFVCPRDTQVSFTGVVSGGGPFFVFPFLQPRSDPTDPDNYPSTTRSEVRTVTFSPDTVYRTKDLGDVTARLRVDSYSTATAPVPNLSRETSTRIICRCQPFVLVLNQGDGATIAPSVSVMDLNRTTSPKLAENFLPRPLSEKEKATDLVADPARLAREASKVGARYALITANSDTGARVYRMDLATDVLRPLDTVFQAPTVNETFEQIDISRDGTVAIVTANSRPAGSTRRYYRLNLDNGNRVGAGTEFAVVAGGTLAGVKLSADGSFGLGIDSVGGAVERIANPLSAPDAALVLTASVLMAPRFVDISLDDKLAVVTNSAPGDTNIALVDIVRQERRFVVPGSSSTQVFGVRFHPTLPFKAYYTLANGIGLLTTTDGTTVSATQGQNLAQAVVPAGLRGIDVSFEASYAIAAAEALDQILVLQLDNTDGANPFSAGTNAFGAAIPVGTLTAGKKPLDVAIVDRLQFGQPIIRLLDPNPVVAGGVLTIRGSNMTPRDRLRVTVGGKDAVRLTGAAGGDDFTVVKVTLAVDTPIGDQDVVVTNDSIASTNLKSSAPVKVRVQ
jgi:competence protein ComGC